MASLLELLQSKNKLNLNYNQPVQQQVPAQQPVYQRPTIDPAIEEQYMQNMQPQGLAKYGLTPGNLTNIAAGVTALTGGDPYMAGGLAQAGGQLSGQEAQAEQARQARLSDYVKGIRGQQSAYDKSKQNAEQAVKLQQLKNIEKQDPIETIKQLGDIPEGYRLGYDKTGKQILEKAPLGGIEDQQFQREKGLRSEFTKSLGDYPKIIDSYGRIQASAEEPSAAGDLALIFNYMKMLDPGSVVRESEFQNAASTGAWGERLKAAADKLIEGKRLSTEMRADFLDRSNRLFNAAEDQAKQNKNIYREKANQYELDPKRVIVDIGYKGKRLKKTKAKQKQSSFAKQTPLIGQSIGKYKIIGLE